MARQLFFVCSLLTILFGASLTLAFAQNRPSRARVLRVAESKPITVNDARFITVTEAEWFAVEDENGPRPVHVQARLRITNLKKTDVIFHTFGTFGITLKKQNGTEVKPACGRDHTSFTRPLLLPGGATFPIIREAELTWDIKAKASTLVYRDGTGKSWSYGPLKSGKYKLSFWYSTTRFATTGQDRPIANVPSWTGDARTPEVSLDIINPVSGGTTGEKGPS